MTYLEAKLLCLCAALAVLPAAVSANATTIVVNIGEYDSARAAGYDEAHVDWSDADYADDTICTVAFAAAELQHYLRKMTGDAGGFPIVDDDAVLALPPDDDLVLIGGPASNAVVARLGDQSPVSQAALDEAGREGYVIKTVAQSGRQVTVVAGGGRTGTMYGAYDLLHRLGVRWYAPGEVNEEVPQKALERLPVMDVAETPKFFTRGFHAWENRGNPDFLIWMARNRMNYWCVEQEEKALLHKLGIMLVGGGHVLTSYYLDPRGAYPYNHPKFDGDEDKPDDPYAPGDEYRGDANGDGTLTYFEAHPEWYALRDGKRSDRIHGDGGDNFCTSNKDAMAEWMKNAVDDLAEGRYKDANIMNAWTLDGGKWCECEHCQALGSRTDRNLLFIHAYDKAVKQAQAEGRINRPVRFLFLAYADVLEPPTHPLPEDFDYDTGIATYFPIRRCYVYNFDDPRSSYNANYMKHLQGWAVEPDRHYRGQLCIGEYYNVSGYKCLPICYMHTMANDIPYYYSLGARHFHYMHCTTKNWGNKALTNWQMARQIWDPSVDCAALWDDYFNGRYGAAAKPMRAFYQNLEKMLCNCSELKYGLSRRLDRGADDLFPTQILKYEKTEFDTDDGPDLLEILEYAAQCREIIDGVAAMDLPERIAYRVAEDDMLFTYGERTMQFFDALCRAYFRVREGKREAAQQAFKEARELADLLEADTESTQHASSHANAANALVASYASGALAVLPALLGPMEPSEVKALDPASGLTLEGRDFIGGGALRYGHGLHVFPDRIKVSDVGNYVYGAGAEPCDRMKAWFKLEAVPEGGLKLLLVGLKCPEPIGGDVHGLVLINDQPVFDDNVLFGEKGLTEHAVSIPAAALKPGENAIEIRNTQPNGSVGGRPWFGIDRVQLGGQG